jgi:hypothetical protein
MKKLMNSLLEKDAVFLSQQKEKRGTRFREKHHYLSKKLAILQKKQHSFSKIAGILFQNKQQSLSEEATLSFKRSSTIIQKK